MRKLATAALVAVALLGSAPVAAADPPTTNPAPPNGTLTMSLGAGYRYWQERGIQPVPLSRLRVFVTPLPTETIAEAQTPGTDVWIGTLQWSMVSTDLPRRGPDWLTWRRIIQRDFCTVVLHELGHTAGLQHNEGGPIMSGADLPNPPAECTRTFPLQQRSR
jgi:hypothetical protein